MNFRKLYLVTLFVMLAGLSGAAAESVEIFRNSKPYIFNIALPMGLKFTKKGIDRNFVVDGIEGNFRLIQDDYNDCSMLTQERKANKLKEGFAEVLAEKVGSRECYVKLRNRSTGQLASSFYIFMHKCACYSAFHLSGPAAASDLRNRILQPVLDQIRANNGAVRSKTNSLPDVSSTRNAKSDTADKFASRREEKPVAKPGSDAELIGLWYEIGGETQIEIAPCGDSLCGVVVAFNGSKHHEMVGRSIFYNIEKSGTNTWSGNARSYDGKVYEGKLTLNGNTMKTSGCVLGGIICDSASWSR